MKWEGRQESENVEDRRGLGKKTGLAIGGGGILVIILALLVGAGPRQVAQLIGQQQGGAGQEEQKDRPKDAEEERMATFSKVIFHDTEEVWDEQFRKMGRQYRRPTLVLFSGQVESACGMADAAVGPFYCP